MSQKASRDPHSIKICLVSSSGGHWEQLKRLKPILARYSGFLVTENTPFIEDGPYLMVQTDLKDILVLPKMVVNTMRAIRIWKIEEPDIVITTGTMVAFPFYILAILFKKKFVFIETFGRANQPTIAGRLMQKHSDLFFVQWATQKRFYPKSIYVGSLY